MSSIRPRYLDERLNFEYSVQALNYPSLTEATRAGFDVNDLSRDANLWRSNQTGQIDIYIEISDPDELDCFAIINTNLSKKSLVFVSGSLSSGVGGFNDPTFSAQLIRKGNDFIFYSKTKLPSSQYFKITIIDNEPIDDHYQIGKIICGITKEFPLEIVDGYTKDKESYQKRELVNAQWLAGTKDSKLDMFSYTLRPANSTRMDINNEYESIKTMLDFYDDMKGSNPFLFIYNPEIPEDDFCYVVLANDQLEFYSGEDEQVIFTLNLKETR